MSKQKTLAELNAEKEKIEQQLVQERHKIHRLEDRTAYYEKGDRRKRARHSSAAPDNPLLRLPPIFLSRIVRPGSLHSPSIAAADKNGVSCGMLCFIVSVQLDPRPCFSCIVQLYFICAKKADAVFSCADFSF